MGLKIDNYKIEKYDMTVPHAYGYCECIFCSTSGVACANFGVYQTREDALNKSIEPFDIHNIDFVVDKNLPLWEQAYTQAKLENNPFYGWEDDIVEG